MSLGSALNASVSGLKAQSAAIAAVSENIANSNTTAYKGRAIAFESLVTGSGASSLNQLGGGVRFTTSQNVSEQGLIENTGVSTNVAISGSGFFVVAENPDDPSSAYMYTRNGDFDVNEDGILINNEGMILLGQAVDEDGNVTAANSSDLNSLQPIDLNAISGTAQATTSVDVDINLPSDSDIYNGVTGEPEYITAIEVFDDLGVSHTIEVTYRKTAVNTWDVVYADPYQTSEGSGSTATGTISPATQTVTFDGDGAIDLIDGVGAVPFDVTISGLSTTTGANDMTFELDLGFQGGFDGLTQFASNSSDPDLEIDSIEQDGVRYGTLSGAEINDDGLVIAAFDNGVRLPIYSIPIATFSNPAGLTNVQGTIYDENEKAGNLILQSAGQGNTGNIVATSLELSTIDSSSEFNKMIVAQQAYSSAAQIVSTVDEMFETLISSVR